MPRGEALNSKTELAEAIIEDNLVHVQSLLSAGANTDEFSYFYGHGEPPLLTAIRYGRSEIIKELLWHGTNVNLRSDRGQTALVQAAERNLFTLMGHLIKHGVDVNAVDSAGHSALYWAVKARNMDAIYELVRSGAELNSEGSHSLTKPLLHLVTDSVELSRCLLDLGAKVNALDDMHETALFPAVRADNISVVELLLTRGVKVNKINDDSRTALHLAAASVNNSVEITKLLLQHGAEINSFDRYLNTPLVLTLRSYILQPNKEVARCLIRHGSLVQYKMCAEALEWTIGTDLELLQYAVWAGLKLSRLPWIRELLSNILSKRQWHIMGQDCEQKDRIINFVRNQLQTVHSLSESCRIVIREKLIRSAKGHSILPSIQQLPIPQTLKEYLMLPES